MYKKNKRLKENTKISRGDRKKNDNFINKTFLSRMVIKIKIKNGERIKIFSLAKRESSLIAKIIKNLQQLCMSSDFRDIIPNLSALEACR